jgi:hypothetical protein
MEVHGWDCAFETDLEKIRASKPANLKQSSQINEATCFNDLLKGFFEFYSSFKFSESSSAATASSTASLNIVSTRSAQVLSLSRSELKTSSLTKFSDFINMQDPFDLSHNLTANISSGTVDRFVFECRSSNKQLTYSTFPRKSLIKSWGLTLLMTKKALPIATATTHSTKISTAGPDSVEVKVVESTSNKKEINFVLYLLKNCLHMENLVGDKMISLKRKKPLKVLNQICDQVDSLGLNCSPKRLRIDVGKDASKSNSVYVSLTAEQTASQEDLDEDEAGLINNNNEKLIETYQFSAKYNTWQGRRPLKRELKQKNANMPELELEELTTRRLVERQTKEADKSFETINFSVQFLNCENSPNKLKVKFDLLNDPNNESANHAANFATLVHFLDIYINNCQQKLISEWSS